MPPISKDHISYPLEAGSSLLDVKRLPMEVTTALEYVSSKLARKNMHFAFIVIRKEVQVPSTGMTPDSATFPSPTDSIFSKVSSSSSVFSRALSKSSSRSSLRSAFSSGSSTCSSVASSASLSRTQYPSLPTSPRDFSAAPRLNVLTATTSPALPCMSPSTPNPFGITLLQTAPISPRSSKFLNSTIERAEKRYPSIGTGWLVPKPYTTTSAPTDLIARSLSQNEIIFASGGLTLLSLDHVYTFKTHLQLYSRTLTPPSLTLAVDELRRLILAQGPGTTITKSHLTRSYPWLGISFPALVDINQAYKTAYGGSSRSGAIDVAETPVRTAAIPTLSLTTSFTRPTPTFNVRFSTASTSSLCSETSYFSPVSPYSSSDPGTAVPLTAISMGESARGVELDTAISYQFDLESAFPGRGPGPLTPNRGDDITPVTKGEWTFLRVDASARRGAVETC
ncbi:hypothetical protein GLAREA_11596 [Glarea lozoyensis ATCC 20868]|uniref:DUF7582 domain-containing protein n=1 Tax=Glarea lozoyensis (strain ATCC 20868 / MF5171) TaxID=1116229 RepID=S3CGI5_GLAL2|nr:uncharacterized protein GLAREA_11596 [Glarea lozoyensis ATCC 20868]EPE25015.1 hypothetical protein GLAREA_11596 [Glarea lozoyensis ATCC 20868]